MDREAGQAGLIGNTGKTGQDRQDRLITRTGSNDKIYRTGITGRTRSTDR